MSYWVAVSGAGIAGMSVAIALAKKGVSVFLFEKDFSYNGLGAGIQLTPNATSLLQKWGVLDSLSDHAVEPDRILLRDGKTGKRLFYLDELPILAKNYWNSPYMTVHRADLHTAFKTLINKMPLIHFNSGYQVISSEGSLSEGFDVRILHKDISKKLFVPLLISCDGVGSRMRRSLSEKARFSGYVAWRLTVSVDEVPEDFLELNGIKTICGWIGKGQHLVVYPLRNGLLYNFVAITEKKFSLDLFLHSFSSWSPVLFNFLKTTRNQWTFWPLFQMPLFRFFESSIGIFLGDAAHALTPFAAQGAAMAIEDGAAFAAAFVAEEFSLKEALLFFESERHKRLKAVARRTYLNGCVYHAYGPIAFCRNVVMKMRSASKFVEDINWLYSYNATEFINRCKK